MNRHITNEMLSAYLDYEVPLPLRRNLEAHLAGCEECRVHLASMQRVVTGLGHVARAVPPQALAARIRYQVEARPASSPFERLKDLLMGLPLRTELRTHFAMACGLLLCVYLVGHGIEAGHRGRLANPPEEVTVYFGEDLGPYPFLVTTKVAGRTFVLNDRRVWVEEGLDVRQAKAHVDTQSPEGQEILGRFSDLGYLLADGARVVLRHNTGMLELSSSHS